jgi:mono/diheme cytochrome c family protein
VTSALPFVLAGLLLTLSAGCKPRGAEDASAEVPAAEINGSRMFQRNCAACHGALGRGDGPSSSMTRPANLADPTVQDRLDLVSFQTVVRGGRGVMPAFARLSDAEIEALHTFVRSLRSEAP